MCGSIDTSPLHIPPHIRTIHTLVQEPYTMIDIKLLRENPEHYKTSTEAKGGDPSIVDTFLGQDELRRKLIAERDTIKAEQNNLTKQIQGASNEERPALIHDSKALGDKVKALDEQVREVEEKWNAALYQIPNPIHESVHLGKSDEENTVERTEGEVPAFGFEPKEHWELGEMHDCLDLEAGAKVSGSRFVYTKNDFVLLEFALIQFVLHKLIEKGFTPMMTPYLVRERAMWGTGFLPNEASEIYHVNPDEDNLYLIGTSEVTLVNYHDGDTLDAKNLPLRYVGFSSCFRREAGTYGKDMKGLIRLHQFEKVEMVSFTHPDKSWEEHEFLRECEEEILKDLGIPYQVINICSGDLGGSAAKKYDLEGWFPAQGKYRELTSTSNTTDFQSRRLGIKYKDGDKKDFVHVLNGTATSMRPLASLVENYQQEDGSILVPEVLQPYMGGKSVIGKKD